MDMKRVSLSSKGRGPKQLHIEADGCIINIQVGLHDSDGNAITHVSVAAQGDTYQGEPEWWIAPGTNVARTGVGLRVIQKDKSKRKSRRSSRR